MADEDALDEAIDRWMRERATPAVPDGFTPAVMTRVRQERWQAERYWDVAFNVAVAAGLALVMAGMLGLIQLSGLSVVARDTVMLFVQAVATVAAEVTPVLPTYVGAVALIATALGLWWYVENY
ncbi:MAG: hypothetical protein ACRD26_20865 [Vicinamibacterales bacterium]